MVIGALDVSGHLDQLQLHLSDQYCEYQKTKRSGAMFVRSLWTGVLAMIINIITEDIAEGLGSGDVFGVQKYILSPTLAHPSPLIRATVTLRFPRFSGMKRELTNPRCFQFGCCSFP